MKLMKRGVIDRFEGEIAVIEFDGETIDVKKALLPKKACVGDAIIIEDDGTYRRKQRRSYAKKSTR